METYRTIPVVKQLLLACFFTSLIFLTACSTNESDSPKEIDPHAGGTITASDTSQGVTLSLDSIKVADLRLNLQPHQTVRYRITSDANLRQDKMTMDRNEDLITEFTVDNVDNSGNTTVRLKFKKIATDTKINDEANPSPLPQVRFNSDDSTQRSDPKFLQFASLLDTPIGITVNKRNRVIRVTGAGAIVDRVTSGLAADKAMGQNPNELDKQRLQQAIEGTVITPKAQMLFPSLPDSAITEGLEWTRTERAFLNELLAVKTTDTFRITSIRMVKGKKLATIEAKLGGVLSLRPVPDHVNPKPTLKLKSYNLSGTARIIVDLETGLTIHNKTTVKNGATIELSAPGQPAKTLVQNQNQTFTVELLP